MSDQFPCMIYRAGGEHDLHGVMCDYMIVEHNEELGTALACGWSLSPLEAAEYAALTARMKETPPVIPMDAPPTRAEMEQKARELGIIFDGRTTDAKLAAKIAQLVKEEV